MLRQQKCWVRNISFSNKLCPVGGNFAGNTTEIGMWSTVKISTIERNSTTNQSIIDYQISYFRNNTKNSGRSTHTSRTQHQSISIIEVGNTINARCICLLYTSLRAHE